MEFSVLGPVAVRDSDGDVRVSGAKRRALLCLLLLNANRVVPADRLIDDLWEGEPPESAAGTLQSHISHLRRLLGPELVQTRGGGYVLEVDDDTVDAAVFDREVAQGRAALAAGDAAGAVTVLTRAIRRWRGPAYDDAAGAAWAVAEAARLDEARLVAIEALFDARLALGDHGTVAGEAEAAVAANPLRERLWGQLMLALYRDGRQAEALRAYQRVRTHLAEELGIEPGAELRALEQAILNQDRSISAPVASAPSLPSGVVTFLLTDVVGSTELWDTAVGSMPDAVARHSDIISAAVRGHDGVTLKPRGEGDSTFSVFRRASDGAAAAVEAQTALQAEPWPPGCEIRVRIALHTGEAFERDGDFFGPALNRAARLRSLAEGGQILVSQATAELIRDHLIADTALESLGHHDLRGLSRGEHVYALVIGASETGEERTHIATLPVAPPPIPGPLVLAGPFVGRVDELTRLDQEWQRVVAGQPRAALVGGEPGVGKTRLAAECARRVHEAGALVLYGRCDEDLGAPYQPFAEAFRSMLPAVGAQRLAAVRGVEEVARLVPELADLVPSLGLPTRGDPDTERYALFDAVTRLLVTTSAELPLLVVLDDLHWATKPTLLLLRHILRNSEGARLHIVGTYRTTDLDPAHPLSATLADLHRDGSSTRIVLGGLGEREVTAYLGAAGYDDDDLANTLASVTSGNPFFLLEVLRHLDETGGRWDPTTLPQGVREAVGRRLTRLSPDANEALLAGAVVGGRFALGLVEGVVGRDLVDAVSEACDAELVVEERGGWFRFNHDIVRRSLLAGVASVKRVRLHQRIAEQLEATVHGDDTDVLADLAHHYFESAWAGNAAKAVEYCRRAADQAMVGLAYEGAADLYDRALQAMDIDDEASGADDRAELLLARCEALLAAGEVTAATDAVTRLEDAAAGSPRLAAWATCFAGQLAVLVHPDQLDTIEGAVAAAANQLAEFGDDAGEAKAHTVRASCLARLGRHADCETALDRALTAARRGSDARRVNAVLAGAPLAALWGPSPVPRAGGRCLDVIRLLRITTGSPAVEATSTRCQAVLEAFRGRAHAARRMLDKARRSLSELGLRHALLEVDLFAGIVELVDDDAAAAEEPLRRAYAGFRRMGVDADAAQAAALLARACIDLGQDDEADELCTESERLGGHDLKASIAWRTVRAQLLSHQGDHTRARELAEAAVVLAERTDALVDHGDACLALAAVLDAAGDRAGGQRAAHAAADLYERKGAAAPMNRARSMFGARVGRTTAAGDESGKRFDAADDEWSGRAPTPVLDNLATRAEQRIAALFVARDWDGLETLSRNIVSEDRRTGIEYTVHGARWVDSFRVAQGAMAYTPLATRGAHLVLSRGTWTDGTNEVTFLLVDESPREGQLSSSVVFDAGDLAAAFAELDARYLAGEAAPYADVFGLFVRTAADPALLSTTLAPDAQVVDRRLVPLMTADGRESSVALFFTVFAETPATVWARPLAVHALNQRGYVATVHAGGALADGGEFAVMDTYVALVDAGAVTRIEIFESSAVDAALARFEELQGVGRENTAARTARRAQALALAQDFAALGQLAAANVAIEDRRTGVRYSARGREEVLSYTSGSVIHTHVAAVDQDLVASRGDRLALLHASARARNGEIGAEFLRLTHVNLDGQWLQDVIFDADDLDTAFASLDALYLTDEALPHAEVFRAIDDAVAAYNRPEAGNQVLRGAIDLAADFIARITAVNVLDDLGGVVTVKFVGTGTQGASVELLNYVVNAVVSGRVVRIELFGDDLHTALARYAELHAACALENAATRTYERLTDLGEDADWNTIVRDDVTQDDRRTLMRNVAHGLASYVKMYRAGRLTGQFDQEVLAIRGEQLALIRSRWHADDDSSAEVRSLVIIEVDQDARIVHEVGFDPDNVDAALAVLNDRYLAGEGGPFGDAIRLSIGQWHTFNARDWDTYERLLTEDFRSIDHRFAGWGSLDRSGFVDLARRWVQHVPDAYGWTRVIHRVATHGVVSGVHVAGTDFLTVALLRGGCMTYLEAFAVDDLDAALARLDELAPVPELENVASKAHARWRDLFAEARWDDLATAFTEDCVANDHRAGVRDVNHGLDARRDSILAAGIPRGSRMDATVVATRGSRLAIVHDHWSSGDTHHGAPELEFLELVEAADDGRIAGQVTFDASALDDAYAELDRRYLAAEGAPYAATLRPLLALYDAYNRRDWKGWGDLLADDMVLTDHRAASLGTIRGAEETLRAFRAMVELSNIKGRALAVVRVDHGIATILSDSGGGIVDGAPVDLGVPYTTFAVKDGRITWFEIFRPDQREAALARFEELRARRPVLENAATRARRRWQDALLARDWTGLATLLRDDAVDEDRRAGVRARYGSAAAILENSRGVSRLGHTFFEIQVIAIRGNRLSLDHFRAGGSGPGAFEVACLELTEVDGDGRVTWGAIFDEDAYDEAFAALEERYLAGEAAPFARAWRLIVGSIAAMNRRETPALPENYGAVDHRALPLTGTVGDWLWARDVVEAIGYRITSVPRLDDKGVVVTISSRGTTTDGAVSEWSTVAVVTVGDGGGAEIFAEDQLDEALARFGELRREPSTLENTASEARRRWHELLLARDWAARDDILAPDSVLEDRRPGVLETYRGRDAIIEIGRSVVTMGHTFVEMTPRAVRGDRLALSHLRAGGSGPAAYEDACLEVTEVDDDGRITWFGSYAENAHDEAFAALEERYLGGEAAPFAGTWRTIVSAVAAVNRGEVPRVPPRYGGVDHRPLQPLPPGEPTQSLEHLHALVPDLVMRVTKVHRLERHGTVFTTVLEGTTDDGAAVAWGETVVTTIGAGGRTETFNEGEVDAALRRLDELRPRAGELENSASRALRASYAAMLARDWAGVAAGLAEDAVADERRTNVMQTVVGRDAIVDYDRSVMDIGVTFVDSDVVALRGERLALLHSRGGGARYEMEVLHVVEVDDHGRILGYVNFDGDALDDAYDELERRYIAGEAAPYAGVWRGLAATVAAINRHELSRLNPGTVVDHSRQWLPEMGPAESVQSLLDLAPDMTMRVTNVHRLDERGAVVSTTMEGTSPQGVAAAWSVIAVTLPGGRSEIFPDDQLEDALDAFERSTG